MICEGGRRKLSSSTWNGGNQLKCPVYVLLWERPPAIVLLLLDSLVALTLSANRVLDGCVTGPVGFFVERQRVAWGRKFNSRGGCH